MEDQYKPTRKEVFTELSRGINDQVDKIKERTLNTVVKTPYHISLGLQFFAGTSIYLHILPSMSRIQFEYNKIPNSRSATTGESISILMGAFFGSASYLAQLAAYFQVAEKTNTPEVGFIPLATNVASLGYETYRHFYKKAEQTLIEKNNPQTGLENKIIEN